jgi:hypothetical protein
MVLPFAFTPLLVMVIVFPSCAIVRLPPHDHLRVGHLRRVFDGVWSVIVSAWRRGGVLRWVRDNLRPLAGLGRSLPRLEGYLRQRLRER